ncbi:MAG: monomethylamine:corrinoid methyltransferase [Sedimentisphaerales bacterium]|nr:monomethylamine:corrinoid methyltransferase [Sedimentisphaerales bacterium]
MSHVQNILDRAKQGLVIQVESFDLDRIYTNLTELVRKYNIQYTPDNPVPSDDALADRVFAAAVDFCVNCGCYFQNTNTVFTFTRDEVLDAIANYDGDCHFGQGKEARIFRSRKPDSDSRPWMHVGSGIMASSEDIESQIVFGNASIPEADSMSVNALDKIDGRDIITGQPGEIEGAIRSIEVARAAIKRAGRDGLAIINGIATAGSSHATIEAAKVALVPSDAIIVGTFAEFKTNNEMMEKVEYSLNSGTNIVLASAPMVGGYGGGPEANAVLNTAYAFLGMLVYKCNYYLSLPMDMHYGCSTTRPVIWSMALSGQALARNTNMPTLGLAYAAGGPWTESFYYESAAFIAASIASGISIQTPHPAKATLPDYVTPLEMKNNTHLALACAGMTRSQANGIVKSILTRYENGLKTASAGKPYDRCFDVENAKPLDEYVTFVEGINKEINTLGIPMG